MLDTMQPEMVVIAVLIAFSFAAFYLRLLSIGGIALAAIIGITAFMLGGVVPFLALALFYLMAETATWAGRKFAGGERHEQRTSSNILGNCAAAIVALFFGQSTAFFGAVSAAFADTVSSEIGLLSRSAPVLITSWKRVEKGTDGGVTLLGFLAALFAAAIIGLMHYFFVANSAALAGIIVVSGFAGGAFDSFLGATLQRRGILTNTQVNFFAGLFGAAVALALSGTLA